MSEHPRDFQAGDSAPLAAQEGVRALVALALDMRSSWNHATDKLWRQLDPVLWGLTHNPWVVLQTVSREKLRQELADPAFRATVDQLVRSRDEIASAPAWFQRQHPQAPLSLVAYFSMEFMLGEALPIYSGGLGNVAGDQLKAASDLGVPVVGVGLLYQQGYFRQMIDPAGAQQALYPFNDPGQLPIAPVRRADGEWLRLHLDLPGYPIWVRCWQVRVGRVKLYLLDTNDAANFAPYRGITSELYGGGAEMRLMQEMVLGIGGWRLLSALGLAPEVCHLNEGHAAFAALERAREFMEVSGKNFEAALAVTRAGNLFTTHTAVAAGFDRFAPALIERYLGGYARSKLSITVPELLALGRKNPEDPAEDFNMAYLAIRASGAVNGVSRLHGEISRQLFAPLFPSWPVAEVPVGHVTNGIHVPTWDSALADALWSEVCDRECWAGSSDVLERNIRAIPDARLWQFRNARAAELVGYARRQLARQLAAAGSPPEAVDATAYLLDPNILTLGFGRRFATYKRPNLLLADPDRLLALLGNPDRPVQLIMAGKAHPADQPGQDLVQQWIRFIRLPEVRRRIIFLADYDMHLAEHLVQGVDVWLNTPRRPWEACGTSGMKVLVNGGLNLSELDGWWAEAYAPEVGWALGDGRQHDDVEANDAAEAEALYTLLEQGVVPCFYDRDAHGIPAAWVARMRESMARLTQRFSSTRTVQEYAERHYIPAAAGYSRRAANGGARGADLVLWRRDLEQGWAALHFGDIRVETEGGRHEFEVEVFLHDLARADVAVELYAEGIDGAAPARERMRPVRSLTGGQVYAATVPATRPATDYTPRAVPAREGVAVPLEEARICWQR